MGDAGRSTAIANGVSLKLISRLVSVPLGIATLGVSARYLGASQYGMLTSAVVVVGLFQLFADLGVGTVVVRTAGTDQTALRKLVGLDLTISLVLAPVLMISVVGLGSWVHRHHGGSSGALLVVASGLLFGAVGATLNSVFDAHVRYGAVLVGEIAGRVAALAVALLVVRIDGGIVGIAVVQVLPAAVKTSVGWIWARHLVPFRPTWSPAGMRELIITSLPFATMAVVAAVYWRTSGVIVSVVTSPEQLAGYGVASQIAFSLAVLPNAISRSSFSTLAGRFDSDHEAFWHAVRRGFELIVLLALPVAVLGFPLAAPIIEFVTSPEYVRVAAGVLRLFFVAVALSFVTSLVSVALTAARQEHRLAKLSVRMLVLSVILNLALVPLLHAEGAAVALIVTEGLGALIATRMLRGGREPLVRAGFLARVVLICAACAALAVALGGLHVVVAAVILLVVYAAAALALPVGRDAARAGVAGLRRRRRGPVADETPAADHDAS